MKLLALILIGNAFGLGMGMKARPGTCIHPANFKGVVVRLIKKTKSRYTYELMGNEVSPHGIVETTLKFDSAGALYNTPNIFFHWLRTEKMPLENGFDADFDMWTDCQPGDERI